MTSDEELERLAGEAGLRVARWVRRAPELGAARRRRLTGGSGTGPGNAGRGGRVAGDRRSDGEHGPSHLWRKETPIPALETFENPASDGAGTTHHDRLLAHRDGYRARVEQLEQAIAELAAEPASMDTPDEEDAGDADGSNVERDRLLALVATARRGLDDVTAALARLAAGTYGTCERCGEPIPEARLEAVPDATHCVTCKTGGLRLLRRR